MYMNGVSSLCGNLGTYCWCQWYFSFEYWKNFLIRTKFRRNIDFSEVNLIRVAAWQNTNVAFRPIERLSTNSRHWADDSFSWRSSSNHPVAFFHFFVNGNRSIH